MIFHPCSRESQLTAVLRSGHWPDACDPELRSHVKECSRCRDLVLVSQAFQSARSESANVARLEPPGILWWRAQLRRRNAAVERIHKPLSSAHGFALLINLVVVVVLLASQSKHAFRWLLSNRPAFHLEALWAFAAAKHDWNLALVISCLAAMVLLSGIAVYLVSDRH